MTGASNLTETPQLDEWFDFLIFLSLQWLSDVYELIKANKRKVGSYICADL